VTQSAFDLGLAVARRVQGMDAGTAAALIGARVVKLCRACARGEAAERAGDDWWHDHEKCSAGLFRELAEGE
jgi:hypothetical protein